VFVHVHSVQISDLITFLTTSIEVYKEIVTNPSRNSIIVVICPSQTFSTPPQFSAEKISIKLFSFPLLALKNFPTTAVMKINPLLFTQEK
jgi:hypothetical protein